jgi:hypothetical protein
VRNGRQFGRGWSERFLPRRPIHFQYEGRLGGASGYLEMASTSLMPIMLDSSAVVSSYVLRKAIICYNSNLVL